MWRGNQVEAVDDHFHGRRPRVERYFYMQRAQESRSHVNWQAQLIERLRLDSINRTICNRNLKIEKKALGAGDEKRFQKEMAAATYIRTETFNRRSAKETSPESRPTFRCDASRPSMYSPKYRVNRPSSRPSSIASRIERLNVGRKMSSTAWI